MNSLFYSPFDVVNPFGATSYRRAQPAPRRRDPFFGYNIPDDYFYRQQQYAPEYYYDDEEPYYDPRYAHGHQPAFFQDSVPHQRAQATPRQSSYQRHHRTSPTARRNHNLRDNHNTLPAVPQQKIVHIPINRVSRSPSPKQSPQQILNRIRSSTAARIIQRSYRQYRQQQREKAAVVLQHALGQYMTRKSVAPIVQGLRELQSIKWSLSQILNDYSNVWTTPLVFNSSGDMIRGLENKTFFGLEDALVKLLCRLDALQINGDTMLREHRRSVVKKVEENLSKLDKYREEEHDRWVTQRVVAKRDAVDVDWEQLEMDIDADVWSCKNAEGLESVSWPCTVQCS